MPELDQELVQRWQDGQCTDSYTHLGAHPEGEGTWFAVWAPHADGVAVVGAFNGWDPAAHPMERAGGGLWSTFVRGARVGQNYKYRLWHGGGFDKTDPYGFAAELPPAAIW